MRLIHTRNLEIHEFKGDEVPRYAILSHRWLPEEVTLQEFQQGKKFRRWLGYQKVKNFCARAYDDGYRWAWIDTCCIDKNKDSEVSEAINSMFAWYRNSGCCYVFLDDFYAKDIIRSASPAELAQELERCAWFTRGWTLQELIAPGNVLFLDCKWKCFGTKVSLANEISAVTNINADLLRNERELADFSIAQKLSWAAYRQTTKKEDRAYALLGLFDVNLTIVYGELEGHRAFHRLQEALMRKDDHSLFAWVLTWPSSSPFSSILAPSPKCFYKSGSIVSFSQGKRSMDQSVLLHESGQRSYQIKSKGLEITLPAEVLLCSPHSQIYRVALNCYDELQDTRACTIYLRQSHGTSQVTRFQPYCMGEVQFDEIITQNHLPRLPGDSPDADFIRTELLRQSRGWTNQEFTILADWHHPGPTVTQENQDSFRRMRDDAERHIDELLYSKKAMRQKLSRDLAKQRYVDNRRRRESRIKTFAIGSAAIGTALVRRLSQRNLREREDRHASQSDDDYGDARRNSDDFDF